jgi:hypothetical protein
VDRRVVDAGLSLAKAADAYNTQCKSALVPGSGGGGGLPSIPGLDGVLSGAGVPKIVAVVPKWLFKVQDAYLAMHREARNEYEWPLMKVCHDYSLDGIRGRWQPSFDIWSLRSPEATAAAQAGDQSAAEQALKSAQDTLNQKMLTLGNQQYGASDTDAGSSARDRLRDAQDAVRDVRTSGEDRAQKLAGLLATNDVLDGVPPEAVAAMQKAIGLLKGDPKAGTRPLGEVMMQALQEALFDKDPPAAAAGAQDGGILKTFIDKISGAVIATLGSVYRYLHAGWQPLPATVLAAVHEAIAKEVVGLLFSLLLGRDPKANDVKGQQKSAKSAVDQLGQGSFGDALDSAKSTLPNKDELENKAADMATKFLESQGHYIDGIIYFMASELNDGLLRAWMSSSVWGAMTLDTYIGCLPMLAATLCRDLIFPIFNLVLDIFGIGDKLAGAVWNPVHDGIGKVQDVATSVRDKKNQLHDAGKTLHRRADQADDEIDRREKQAQQDLGQLSNFDSAQGMGKQQNAATDLANTVGGAPDGVRDAAMRDPAAAAAGGGGNDKKGGGVLSSARLKDGKAVPVTGLSQVKSAGRETPMAEKDLLKQRSTPLPPAPKPAGGNPFSDLTQML